MSAELEGAWRFRGQLRGTRPPVTAAGRGGGPPPAPPHQPRPVGSVKFVRSVPPQSRRGRRWARGPRNEGCLGPEVLVPIRGVFVWGWRREHSDRGFTQTA